MSEREEHLRVPPSEIVLIDEAREISTTEALEAAETRIGDSAIDFVSDLSGAARDCLASDSDDARELGRELSRLAEEAKERTFDALLALRECARLPPVSAEAVLELFESKGVSGRVVEIPRGVEFQQAVVFPRAFVSDEPLVRVYRGINELDASLLRQVPYALRSRSAAGVEPFQILEHAREQMLAMAERPTHENLMRYVDAVWPDLHDDQIGRFEADLEDIEDHVLSGMPLRRALAFKTFGFNGGSYADTGIPPYLSASGDPGEAAGYGRRGVLVLDIPISKIEPSVGRPDGEVAIRGEIDPSHIAAVLPRGYSSPHWTGEDVLADISRAIDVVRAEAGHSVASSSEADALFTEERARTEEQDRLQWESDARSIRERRARRVLDRYADVGVTRADAEETMRRESVDAYAAAKRAAYDRLADRFERADSRNRRSELEDRYVFDRKTDHETWASEDVHYVREQVTDKMLASLRKLVAHMERRARGE